MNKKYRDRKTYNSFDKDHKDIQSISYPMLISADATLFAVIMAILTGSSLIFTLVVIMGFSSIVITGVKCIYDLKKYTKREYIKRKTTNISNLFDEEVIDILEKRGYTFIKTLDDKEKLLEIEQKLEFPGEYMGNNENYEEENENLESYKLNKLQKDYVDEKIEIIEELAHNSNKEKQKVKKFGE